jgi:predicted peptidase
MNLSRCLLALLFLITFSPKSAYAQDAPAFKLGQNGYVFETKIGRRNVKLNYLLYLPESYGKDPIAKFPLIVFLHGSRELGRDVNRVRKASLPSRLEKELDFPAIVVSPQSPVFSWYTSVSAVSVLIDELQSKLNIDPNRIYLVGLSMGGYGAWLLALEDKERYAGIVSVVAGHLFPAKQLCVLKDIPAWVFAAKKDRSVNPKESVAVVNALKSCGGEPKFTLYEDANHDQGWQRAMSEPDLFKWLLSQAKVH